jgi:hypothetical protein
MKDMKRPEEREFGKFEETMNFKNRLAIRGSIG